MKVERERLGGAVNKLLDEVEMGLSKTVVSHAFADVCTVRYVWCLRTYFDSVCVGLLEFVTWAASSHRMRFENEGLKRMSEVHTLYNLLKEKFSLKLVLVFVPGNMGAWTTRPHEAKGKSNMKGISLVPQIYWV